MAVIVIISRSKGYAKDTNTSSVDKKYFFNKANRRLSKDTLKIPPITLLQQKLYLILNEDTPKKTLLLHAMKNAVHHLNSCIACKVLLLLLLLLPVLLSSFP